MCLSTQNGLRRGNTENMESDSSKSAAEITQDIPKLVPLAKERESKFAQ
jgi:hypothetical protein